MAATKACLSRCCLGCKEGVFVAVLIALKRSGCCKHVHNIMAIGLRGLALCDARRLAMFETKHLGRPQWRATLQTSNGDPPRRSNIDIVIPGWTHATHRLQRGQNTLKIKTGDRAEISPHRVIKLDLLLQWYLPVRAYVIDDPT